MSVSAVANDEHNYSVQNVLTQATPSAVLGLRSGNVGKS